MNFNGGYFLAAKLYCKKIYLLKEFLAETMPEEMIPHEDDKFFAVGHLVVNFVQYWESRVKGIHFGHDELIFVALNLLQSHFTNCSTPLINEAALPLDEDSFGLGVPLISRVIFSFEAYNYLFFIGCLGANNLLVCSRISPNKLYLFV